jgi:FkbM family methyltransferase
LPLSQYNPDSIGSNAWWLRGTRGARVFDKCLLYLLKVIYRGVRFSLRIVLGKKRRDKLYRQRGLNFKDFLYKSIGALGIGNSMLLEFSVPKYDYKVSCPINKEDFIVMTKHEDEIIELFTAKEGDVVIDVGAHMGRYTIISSKRVGQHGKVIAIEAHPDNFEMLNRNIKLNKLTNVIPLNYAVYSKETKLRLYLPDEELGYTMHHSTMLNYVSTKYKIETEGKYVEVNANTLDNLLLQQQQQQKQNGISHADINWIKIDVEGAEFEVLKGATDILSKSKDIALLIEVHGKDNYKPIVEFLKMYNFKIEFEKTYDREEKHILVRKS